MKLTHRLFPLVLGLTAILGACQPPGEVDTLPGDDPPPVEAPGVVPESPGLAPQTEPSPRTAPDQAPNVAPPPADEPNPAPPAQ